MEENYENNNEVAASSVRVADAETPDATADAGTTLAGPPADGEGCQGVTVIVAETTPGHPEYAQLAARSVKANLVGVDALVEIMGYDPQQTLAGTLLQMFTEKMTTERIVLMTDHMVLLNPTSLFELGCRRGWLTPKGITVGENSTPKLMYRSVLLKMLPEMMKTYAAFDVLLEYDNYARPQVMPVIMRQWNQDNWLLPVASERPNPDSLKQWAGTQRFLVIQRVDWPQSVVEFIENRFPE